MPNVLAPFIATRIKQAYISNILTSDNHILLKSFSSHKKEQLIIIRFLNKKYKNQDYLCLVYANLCINIIMQQYRILLIKVRYLHAPRIIYRKNSWLITLNNDLFGWPWSIRSYFGCENTLRCSYISFVSSYFYLFGNIR